MEQKPTFSVVFPKVEEPTVTVTTGTTPTTGVITQPSTNTSGYVAPIQPVTTEQKPKVKKEVAAAWVKVDRNGNQYLSIKIKVNGVEIPYRLFPNRSKKDGDTTPDFIAYEE